MKTMLNAMLKTMLTLALVMLLAAPAAAYTVYQFTVDYGSLGTIGVDENGDGSYKNEYVTDFSVTSSGITLDSSKAAYCVDLYQGIGKGTYSGVLLTLDEAKTALGWDYTDAARLVASHGLSYDWDNDNAEEKLQASIWETLYETGSGYDLTAGSFRAYDDQSGDMTFLTLNTGNDLSAYRVLQFTDDAGNFLDKQELLVKTVVPVPGAVWLLGSGLAGLVAVRRRPKHLPRS